MLEELKRAAEHISRMEGSRKAEAESVRSQQIELKDLLEPQMVLPLSPGQASGRVSAVDGGILNYEMHGADMLIGRAVSSTFTYENGKLASSSYFPGAFSQPEYDIATGLDEREMLWHKSLFRLSLEVGNALKTAEKENPDYLLMDGSLVPLMSDKPSEDSQLFEKYFELVSKYQELFSHCEKNGVRLVGVIKDSRGKRFMEMLAGRVSQRCADTVFLHHLLKEGERTSAFRYSSRPGQHAVLKDIGPWAEKLCVSYIKPVAADRPARIEYLQGAGHDEICNFIASLSGINRTYAYPAVLIDADLRAAMDPAELERAKRTLSLFTGPELLSLRRNSRPFR